MKGRTTSVSISGLKSGRVCLLVGAAVAMIWWSLPTNAFARPPRLERVRHSVTGERTRIVLDLTRNISYQVLRVDNPDRIAINITGALAVRSLGTLNINKGQVDKVRINRLSWGTQVVVDLKGRSEWKDFVLAGTDTSPHRIVIDVMPPDEPPAAVVAAPPRPGATGASDRLIVVAIDAGHGGTDPGSRGRGGLVEKQLTLDTARRVARSINAQSGFRAVLTRDSDVYLDLERRMVLARQKGADVFVSMHYNTAKNRAARGAEIYFVTPAGARQIADQVRAKPDRVAHEYGIKKSVNDDLVHMLVDMNQQSALQRSEALAAAILSSFRGDALPPRRDVKQRSFQVLRTISMPSVLVEAGFITNTRDARIIASAEGRQRIAVAVADGIVGYLRENPPQRRAGDPVVVYKVRQGDTLWKISREYHTSISDLRKVNKLGNRSVLRVGQELVVSRGF